MHPCNLQLRSNNITNTNSSASDKKKGSIEATQSTEPNKPDVERTNEQNFQNIKVLFDIENDNEAT